MAIAQLPDPLRIDVEAQGVALFAEGDGQRQADIAQPDHGDAGLLRSE